MKTYLRILFTVLFTTFAFSIFSQEKKIKVGFQTGVFIPSDWIIQGNQTTYYEDGSARDLNVSGFGNGAILDLNAEYLIKNNTGILLEVGINLLNKRNADLPLAPSGDFDMYENRLTIVPINVCFIYKMSMDQSKVKPYFGAGFNVNFAKWEQKHFPENDDRTWLQGNEVPLGYKFFMGFDVPIYHDLLFNFQFNYNYASTDWTIHDVDTNEEIKYDNLNTGGTGLKFGLAYRF
jgi:outer membrane protein W